MVEREDPRYQIKHCANKLTKLQILLNYQTVISHCNC